MCVTLLLLLLLRLQLAPQVRAAQELLLLREAVNQFVGDALSCVLLVEAALR